MEKLSALTYFPNPILDKKYRDFDGLIELFTYIRKQRVPDVLFS